VRHYKTTAKAGAGATLSQLLAALATAGLPDSYKTLLSSEASYVGMDAQVIFPTLGLPVGNVTGADAGDNAGDPLPSQVSGLLKITTQLGGRANRGRAYIPFPFEGDNDASGRPQAAYVAALDGLGTIFAAARPGVGAGGDTNDFTPVIYHRHNHTTTPISLIVGSTRWATQRRRGNYGRPNLPPL